MNSYGIMVKGILSPITGTEIYEPDKEGNLEENVRLKVVFPYSFALKPRQSLPKTD